MARTIHEIARIAGVSIGTVSRVLNDKPDVNETTRERVRRIILESDYRPSAVARGLQQSRTGALLLVVPSLEDTYFLRAMNRFKSAFRTAGYRLVLGCSDWSAELEASYLEQAMDGLVDGLIITPMPATAKTIRLYAKLAERRFPVVTLELPCPGDLFPNILYDDVGDFRRATEKLFRQGFVKVAFLASDIRIATVSNRHAGWLEAHRLAGKTVDPGLALVSETGADAFDFAPLIALARQSRVAGERLAVLAQNDMLAVRAILAMEKAGLHAQQEVVVIGHGATLPSELQKYPMPSVEIPWREMCDRAMEILLTQIATKGSAEPPAIASQLMLPSVGGDRG